MKNIVILISGRGSNMQALVRANIAGARIAAVLSNNADAAGLACAHYAGRCINIHPSLLPAFPGLHTHRRALEEGCRIAGCTVHFVTEDLDCGPIIAQGAVPVLDGDTEDALAARVLAAEHQILPQAVAAFVSGSLKTEGRRVLQPSRADAAAQLLA